MFTYRFGNRISLFVVSAKLLSTTAVVSLAVGGFNKYSILSRSAVAGDVTKGGGRDAPPWGFRAPIRPT